MYERVIEEVYKANNICILTHERPDGDAIGCSFALYFGLKQLGRNVDILLSKVPYIYRSMEDCKNHLTFSEKKYDLAIALDMSDEKRLGEYIPNFINSSYKIVIDHHKTNNRFGDLNIVSENVVSTSEMIYDLLLEMKVDINEKIADYLYLGILTDSGGFAFPATTSNTLMVAANLIEKGAHFSDIYRFSFNTYTFDRLKMNGYAINKIELLCNNQIAYLYITQGELKQFGLIDEDTEGLVSLGRNIEGIKVSVFIHDTLNGSYKVSLRSNDSIDVSEISVRFGGGGHYAAAGFTSDIGIDELKEKIISMIEEKLGNK